MPDRAKHQGTLSSLHYDRYPYDVGVGGGEVYVSTGSAFGRFLSRVSSGVALDIGCGPGNMLPAVASRAAFAIGIDASAASVQLAQQRCADLAAYVLRADALQLPIADASVDIVVALGSLHHTGDARRGFFELERVLVPGGVAFVSLYRAKSYYDWLYQSVGALARASSRIRLTDRLVNRLMLLPLFALYFWGGRAVVHRKGSIPSYRHLANYFADQFLNPVVSFHSEAEVCYWADEVGMGVVSISVSHVGALQNVTLRKP